MFGNVTNPNALPLLKKDNGASRVNYKLSGPAWAVARTIEEKFGEVISLADLGRTFGVSDDTAAILNVLNYAYTSGKGYVYAPSNNYRVDGSLPIPAGVTLIGSSLASEYYPGEASNAVYGSKFTKPAGGSDGPIFIMSTASTLSGVYLKHEKAGGATTGIIQMGGSATSDTLYNANVKDVQVYGHVSDDVTGATTCYGLYFPDSDTATAKQRYFNHVTNLHVTNCDIALHLGENSNGNTFGNIITRQCIVHYDLDGGSSATKQVVDNIFTGLVLANIGVVGTSTNTCFKLSNKAQWNNFIGYVTECNGKAFDIDDSSAGLNMFIGQENETIPSFVPVGGVGGPSQGSIHSRWQRPINVEQYSNMILPSLTGGAKFESTVIGSSQKIFTEIEAGDGLPALDGAGTLVAGAAHSRVLINLNSSVFAKTLHPNFKAKLTLFVEAAGTSGNAMAEVEFIYTCTNTSTSAGVLRVTSVELSPAASNYIAGLKFITGVTDASNFKIAMVGGNLSATPAARVVAKLEMDVFKAAGVNRDLYTAHDFTAAAVTANDVTDALDMLTVGDAVV